MTQVQVFLAVPAGQARPSGSAGDLFRSSHSVIAGFYGVGGLFFPAFSTSCGLPKSSLITLHSWSV